jgi:hypothetical protein
MSRIQVTKIIPFLLVLIIIYAVVPAFHIRVKNEDFYEENDTAFFKISNNGLLDGKRANVGWKIEQKVDGKWETVLEPDPHMGGVAFAFSAGDSFTRSISLKGLSPGVYRFSEVVFFLEQNILVVSEFIIK